jgi:hypothetical protein
MKWKNLNVSGKEFEMQILLCICDGKWVKYVKFYAKWIRNLLKILWNKSEVYKGTDFIIYFMPALHHVVLKMHGK